MAHFSEIIGHKEIIRTLNTSLNEAKVGHAYLFTGPAGIGKKTLARAFAARLLCHENSAAPDCRCPGCLGIRTNSHPDLITVLPDGNSIKIEQLRQLQHDLFLRPLLGTRKVCFIPDAELLTEAAANSFLKTLEEPPPGVVFLFTAVRADLILATIRSRCQVFQLFPVPIAEIAAALVKKGFDETEAFEKAKISQGIPGKVLTGSDRPAEKLLELGEVISLSLLDLFKVANDLEKKERRYLVDLFKNWEIQARRELILAPDRGLGLGKIKELTSILEKIGRTIEMLESNVNLRLALEEFFLTLKTI